MKKPYSIQLDWKSHDIDISALHEWFKDSLSEFYECISVGDSIKVRFSSLPSEEDVFLVNGMWEELDDRQHDMCKNVNVDVENKLCH